MSHHTMKSWPSCGNARTCNCQAKNGAEGVQGRTSRGGSFRQLKDREAVTTDIRWKITSGGSRRGIGGGQHNWKDPNRVLVFHDSADPSEVKVLRAHAPQGACEVLVRTFKWLANQQTSGDSFVETILEG